LTIEIIVKGIKRGKLILLVLIVIMRLKKINMIKRITKNLETEKV
jgi:hypothetical protein